MRLLIRCAMAVLALASLSAATPARRAPKPRLDFSLYQQLLTQHVWTVSDSGQPLETRFNYEGFFDEKGRAERAFRIRRLFESVDPAGLDVKNRRAWAINFYNFMVIEQITDHLLIPGKVRQRYLSVRDIKLDGEDFFKHPVVKIDTVRYSLDDFEKHFLFDDFERKPNVAPPATLDPRIHFAIVCGAIGCPPLQPRAFRAESLEIQLNSATRQSLASPKHFLFTSGSANVRISALFIWYAQDFGGPQAAVGWAAKYTPKETRAELEKIKDRALTAQINWDWKLNQVIGWRFQYQMDKPMPGAAAAKDTT
ncbi:MAG: DUF547 domain-containing protein [Candidatus Eisenbacteria bacterium]